MQRIQVLAHVKWNRLPSRQRLKNFLWANLESVEPGCFLFRWNFFHKVEIFHSGVIFRSLKIRCNDLNIFGLSCHFSWFQLQKHYRYLDLWSPVYQSLRNFFSGEEFRPWMETVLKKVASCITSLFLSLSECCEKLCMLWTCYQDVLQRFLLRFKLQILGLLPTVVAVLCRLRPGYSVKVESNMHEADYNADIWISASVAYYLSWEFTRATFMFDFFRQVLQKLYIDIYNCG